MKVQPKYYIPLLLIFAFFSSEIYAQTCTEVLNAAQTAYDEGRIHEINENFWGDCLNSGSSLNDEERVQAFRLMTLVWLQLDEPEKADQTMLQLLDANPEYQINDAIDPTEFINLYNTFRTDPILRIGVRGGGSESMFFATETSPSVSDPQYSPRSVLTFGFQVGASVEIDLFDKLIILNPEVFYSSYKVTTRFNNDFVKNGTNTVTTNTINLNAVAHYNFFSLGNLDFLATLGIGGLYTLSNNGLIVIEQLTTDGADSNIQSPTLDYSENLEPLNAYVTAGAAIRFKFGRPTLTLDMRYQYGFLNNNSGKPYSSVENTFNYGGINVISPATLQNIVVNAGIQFPIFKHEKLELE